MGQITHKNENKYRFVGMYEIRLLKPLQTHCKEKKTSFPIFRHLFTYPHIVHILWINTRYSIYNIYFDSKHIENTKDLTLLFVNHFSTINCDLNSSF